MSAYLWILWPFFHRRYCIGPLPSSCSHCLMDGVLHSSFHAKNGHWHYRQERHQLRKRISTHLHPHYHVYWV